MNRLLMAVACLLVASTASAKDARPNFLFIIVDDQSPFDFKAYDPHSQLDSPNIERLAREGMVLDAAHHMGSWSGAVCTPSRTMIMTGRTVWHIPDQSKNLRGNPNARDPKLVPPDIADNTLAAVFHRGGYETMRTCKIGNSYEAANKRFDVRKDATRRGGTVETDSPWHAEQVLSYLSDRQGKKDAAPFLIYFGFSHPHDPRNGKSGVPVEVRGREPQGSREPPAVGPEAAAAACQPSRGASVPDRSSQVARRGRGERCLGASRRADDPQRAGPRVRVQREHRYPGRPGPQKARGDGRAGQHVCHLHLRPRDRDRTARPPGEAESLRAHLARPLHREGSGDQGRLARRGTSTCSTSCRRSATSPGSTRRPRPRESASVQSSKGRRRRSAT